MCLAVPGRVIELSEPSAEQPLRMGRVDFDGLIKEICLAALPQVDVGDWVIVHAGIAIQQLDEAEAERVLGWLEMPS